ncbi:MAG TPA: hypothetical protein VL728_12900 [Cyclobacteriaceae bacterium]|nr:hypothetical protein [Cyclobacteriaceae bacterium]
MSILLIVSASSDAASYVLARMRISNLPVVNAYFIVSFALLLIFYSILMERRKVMILVIGQILLAYFILNSLDRWGDFRSINIAMQSAVLVLLAHLYYFDLYKQLPTDNLARFAPMWLNAAILFYYSFNLFLFWVAEYVIVNFLRSSIPAFENMSTDSAFTYWGFHNINNIAKNILFAVGIYVVEGNKNGK